MSVHNTTQSKPVWYKKLTNAAVGSSLATVGVGLAALALSRGRQPQVVTKKVELIRDALGISSYVMVVGLGVLTPMGKPALSKGIGRLPPIS